MAVRAMIVKDRRVAVNPKTRAVVVGDSETGKGAECCCGGGSTGGTCCELAGQYACIGIDLDSPSSSCGRRTDISITGSVNKTVLRQDNDPFGVGEPRTLRDYRQKTTTSLSGYIELIDPNASGACLSRGASSGSGNSSGSEKLLGYPQSNWNITFPKSPGSFGRSYGGVSLPCHWSAAGGPGSSSAAGAGYYCGEGYKKSGSSTLADDIGVFDGLFPGPTGCSGSRSDDARDGNGEGFVITQSFGGSASPGGGSFSSSYTSLQYKKLPPSYDPVVLETITYSASVSWSVSVSPCTGASNWPGCAAFVAAFIAGDTSADFNKDGYVTGDDFDLAMLQHPECSGPAGRAAGEIEILRKQKRAVRDATTPASLLGIA